MSEPFIAEIKIFAGNFAPRGWAFCNGQLLPIAQNSALFALLGTIYGGDGRTTVGLPNLEDRVPMHWGNGPGLTPRRIGERGGTTSNTLTVNQIPSHTHTVQGANAAPNASSPAGARPANAMIYEAGDTSGGLGDLDGDAMADTGGGQAFSPVQPYLTLNFIIALTGLFPSRN